MCGISGIFASRAPDLAAQVQRMNTQVAHRGPDGDGLWQAPGLCLGHRRLAIVDLSPAGAQPMHYRDRYVVVFNGEIYNHIELRQELALQGHRFVSHADTEVILAAYAQWGADCLARFNGMWAFMLYDRVAQTLFVARDRFGVKPLYYRIAADGSVAFASEIKQFSALPDWRPTLNGPRGGDYLLHGLIDHDDETLFAGVYQLRGGECCTLDLARPPATPGGRLPVRRWYELPLRPAAADLPAATSAFRELFADAVRLRLRADVPVGSCLSGGLDSSAIVCQLGSLLAAQGGAGLQKTFTARSHRPELDEWRFAGAVVARTGVESHTVFPGTDDLFRDLDALLWHQDEPFGSTSIYAQWSVFRLARACGVKVVLDGQGADEQLGGYTNFIGPHVAGLLASGHPVRAWNEWYAAARARSFAVAFASLLGALLPRALQGPARALAGESGRPAWLAAERLGRSAPETSSIAGARSLRAHSRRQMDTESLPMLLHWEDRDSMAHGVEARVPFLDYRLVELVHGLPDELKIRAGVTKFLLRVALRGLVPDDVLARRDKIGFATAEESWMRRESPQRFRAALACAVDASAGILLPAALDDFDRMVAGRMPFTHLAWRQICFGAWMARFGVRP